MPAGVVASHARELVLEAPCVATSVVEEVDVELVDGPVSCRVRHERAAPVGATCSGGIHPRVVVAHIAAVDVFHAGTAAPHLVAALIPAPALLEQLAHTACDIALHDALRLDAVGGGHHVVNVGNHDGVTHVHPGRRLGRARLFGRWRGRVCTFGNGRCIGRPLRRYVMSHRTLLHHVHALLILLARFLKSLGQVHLQLIYAEGWRKVDREERRNYEAADPCHRVTFFARRR
mmetsp:Transcript_51334/g.101372  ORF Transcript_51334/g.101372 Transcript_51334/m.101372 type:complete len:232 (-) Transcript_51334:29-724(-)